MHLFMLILTLAGHPEHAAAICETYKQCSDKGAEIAALYAAQLGAPKDFSYRVIPVVIMPEPTT